jgi:hypothetical protein
MAGVAIIAEVSHPHFPSVRIYHRIRHTTPVQTYTFGWYQSSPDRVCPKDRRATRVRRYLHDLGALSLEVLQLAKHVEISRLQRLALESTVNVMSVSRDRFLVPEKH